MAIGQTMVLEPLCIIIALAIPADVYEQAIWIFITHYFSVLVLWSEEAMELYFFVNFVSSQILTFAQITLSFLIYI